MAKTRSKQQDNKRKNSPSDSEQETKIRKINKNSNNQDTNEPLTNKEKDLFAYSSKIFNLDLTILLIDSVKTTLLDIFFNYQAMRDEMIKAILKNYEDTLMNENCSSDSFKVNTYGKMNLQGNVQSRRNQCKVVTEEECEEMYMCVHSKEFTKNTPIKCSDDHDAFVFDRWLVYRCDAMKTSFKGFKVFQTLSGLMNGNKKDTKSFHWLGIHRSHCTIRQLEWEVTEITNQKKDKSSEEIVPKLVIQQEIAKSTGNTPLDLFIPRQFHPVEYPFEIVQSQILNIPLPPVQQELPLENKFVVVADEKYEDILQNDLPVQSHQDTVWFTDFNESDSNEKGNEKSLVSEIFEKDVEENVDNLNDPESDYWEKYLSNLLD